MKGNEIMLVKRLVGIDYTGFPKEDRDLLKKDGVHAYIAIDELDDQDCAYIAKYLVMVQDLKDEVEVKNFVLNSKFWVCDDEDLYIVFVHTKHDGETSCRFHVFSKMDFLVVLNSEVEKKISEFLAFVFSEISA